MREVRRRLQIPIATAEKFQYTYAWELRRVSGEPPLWPVFRPLLPFRPDLLQMVFWPPLWILLHPSICPSNHPGHLSALAGTCYAIRPGITVDTSGHVLLGSY
jgi:hypothetical protein